MRIALAAVMLAAMAAGPPTVVSEQTHRPEHIGQCFTTRVAKVETRLEDEKGHAIAGSGSAISLADGHYTVGYDQLPAIDRSRVGDTVTLCVVALPSDCPAGDTRGIEYHGRNLRTGLTWKAYDSEHLCGGA